MPRITPLHFYQYLKCPSWVWLDAFGDAEKRRRIHPFSEKLWRQGLIYDKELVPSKQFVTVAEEDLDEAAMHTLELMKRGTQTIYRGVLLHENWVARPDILERVQGQSILGDYYYVACDLKRIRALEEVHKFQAAFYSLLLERITGTRPLQGYVLTPEGIALSFLVEDVLLRFHLVLSDIEGILGGKRPVPFLTSGCRESPWIAECINQTEACDDLSLVSHITRDEREALLEAGVITPSALALADLALLKKRSSGLGMKRLEHLQRQARVLVSQKPILVEPQIFPASAIELYIDIETDPLRDVDYLFGVLVREGDRTNYIPFFADRPEDERGAWLAFTNCLAKYRGAPVYHYGHYEIEVIRRLAEKYGHALEYLEKTIDIGKLASQAAVFPVYFYSLKDIAKTLGFRWQHPEASGLNSIFWYHKWIETENRKVREDILAYNEDDLQATMLVKDWLAGL